MMWMAMAPGLYNKHVLEDSQHCTVDRRVKPSKTITSKSNNWLSIINHWSSIMYWVLNSNYWYI